MFALMFLAGFATAIVAIYIVAVAVVAFGLAPGPERLKRT